ncbi:hypothetical protein E4U41_006902 [Claviceps citrina]|nr:hypothetical protein E4U41_006902 [Claviceps citrina]
MASQKVLKFPRTDQDSSFVLVHVAPRGSKPLDLKLVGTEGSAPYACSQWQNILISIFRQELLYGIQATATVQPEFSISLTIRKEVQGITQRLGAILLNVEMDETIELFDWCAIAVDALQQSQESATESVAKLSGIQTSLEELRSQLDELIQAKQEDELALLEKFRNLLNEKKVKIRQQQTVIAELSAKATTAPEEPKSADEQPQPKLSGKRAIKRKAKVVEPDEPVEDISTAIKSDAEKSDADDTTEATASAPSSDGDDDEDESMNEPQGSDQVVSEPQPPKQPAAAPPPPRSLPFQRRKPAATINDTGDTESDDEL